MDEKFLSTLKTTTIEALYIYLKGDTTGADRIDMIDEIARTAYDNVESLALEGIAEYLDDVIFYQNYENVAPAQVAAFLKIGKLKGVEDLSVIEKSWVGKNVKIKSGTISKIANAFSFVRNTWENGVTIWENVDKAINGESISAEKLKDTLESTLTFTAEILSTLFGEFEAVFSVFADIYTDLLNRGYNTIIDVRKQLATADIQSFMSECDYNDEYSDIIDKLYHFFGDDDPKECGLTLDELDVVYQYVVNTEHQHFIDPGTGFNKVFEEYIRYRFDLELRQAFKTGDGENDYDPNFYKYISDIYDSMNPKWYHKVGEALESTWYDYIKEDYLDVVDFTTEACEDTFDFIKKTNSLVNDFFYYLAGIDTDGPDIGTDGKDHYSGGDEDNIYYGGDGNDYIFGWGGLDELHGGEGNDHIWGGDGHDQIWGDAGHDKIKGGNGSDTIEGGDGNDRIWGEDGIDTIFGGEGADYINGGKKRDNLYGGNGIDTIIGGDGNDKIYGEGDVDYIDGGDGEDTIYGGNDGDIIVGGEDNDTIYGGNNKSDRTDGNDLIYGEGGDDHIYGEYGNDMLDGGIGDDYLYGGVGDDTLVGGMGEDHLYGGNDNDYLYGEMDDDYLFGENGNDKLYGGEGNDKLYGGTGRDTLDGGIGDDMLNGGEDSDTYIFKKGYGNDRLYDRHGNNTIDFTNIAEEEISVKIVEDVNGKNLVFSIADTEDTLTIIDYENTYKCFRFNFNDGDENSYYTLEGDIESGELSFKKHKKSSYSGDLGGFELPPLLDSFSSGGSDDVIGDYEKATEAEPPRDPLVIDLGTKGIKPSDPEKEIFFDIDNNGFSEKTAWIGSEDGFLVLDRNGDGRITNGTELFSDQIYLSNGQKSKSGFETLAEFDSNGDGEIDRNDAVFSDLRVWIDKNQNGISETNTTDENKKELYTLEELGIESISLKFVEPEDDEIVTENGVTRTAYSNVTFADKKTSHIIENWFEVSTSNTQEVNPSGIDGDRTSFGNMPSIGNAIANDTTGNLNALIERFSMSDNYIEKRGITREIIYFITGADQIAAGTRNGSVDARKLHVLEKIMGVEHFIGAGSSTSPNTNAAPLLNSAYDKFEKLYYSLLNSIDEFSSYTGLLDIVIDENGNVGLDMNCIADYLRSISNSGMRTGDEAMFSITTFLDVYDRSNGTSYISRLKSLLPERADEIDIVVNAAVSAGTDKDDNLNGTSGSDMIYGGDGNDTLNAGAGNDIIYGGSGNDSITAGGGNDHIYGGDGNDTLNGGAGDDTYYFGTNHGNDVVRDTQGNNKLIFSDGISADDYDISIDAKLGFVLTHKETGETISMPDFLTNPLNYNFVFEGESQTEGGIEDREVIEGTDTDDYLEAGDGFNIIYGGDGNDTLVGGKDMDFMYGGDGDDLLLGRNGVNVLFGGNGNDTIYDGDDGSYLSGGDGDDFLYGGGGADVLDGGAGNDYLQGDHGSDTYIFGRGYDTDTINASSDLNTIIIHDYRASSMINTRNAHNDLIINFGSADSTDCLIVDHFFDYNSNRDFNFVFDDGTVLGQYDITAKYAPIYGTDGDDWLAIQNGDNGIIHGGAGNDGLSGGSGNDELYGEDGDDTLYGNDGNDILDGGTGNDTLCGGNGTDTYIFAKGYGNDTINEWGSDHSIVKLTDINSDEVTITDQWGSNLVVSINETEDTLIISNFKWGQATYSFEFADGAIASVNKDTWELEFSKLPDIPETSEDELVQDNADILSELYADDSLTSDILTETDSTVISDISDSVSVTNESDEVADQTDIQVMILTENMSAFADEDNVFDNADVLDSTDDMSMMNQLLVGSNVQ